MSLPCAVVGLCGAGEGRPKRALVATSAFVMLASLGAPMSAARDERLAAFSSCCCKNRIVRNSVTPRQFTCTFCAVYNTVGVVATPSCVRMLSLCAGEPRNEPAGELDGE